MDINCYFIVLDSKLKVKKQRVDFTNAMLIINIYIESFYHLETLKVILIAAVELKLGLDGYQFKYNF